MLRKLRTLKGQNTAEYALLIGLVVGGVIAMQTYAQRSLQARVRDAGQYMANQTSELGATTQYEPYYLNSEFQVSRDSEETLRLDNKVVGMNEDTVRTRQGGGFQESSYNGVNGE